MKNWHLNDTFLFASDESPDQPWYLALYRHVNASKAYLNVLNLSEIFKPLLTTILFRSKSSISFNYPTSRRSPENPESLKLSLIILLHSDKDLSTNRDELTVIVFEKSASKNSTLPI